MWIVAKIGDWYTDVYFLAFRGDIACIFCEDIDHKMNNKIEVYLENDVHADRNEFH